MKVYVVTTGIPYEGDILESIWSTEELANKAKEILDKKEHRAKDFYTEVTEWTVDNET